MPEQNAIHVYLTDTDELKREKHRATSAKWRKENPEKARATSAKSRNKNREKRRASDVKWRKENPEKRRASDVKWRKENPEKARASVAKWYKENPEKRCSYELKRHYNITLAQKEEMWLYQWKLCHICAGHIPTLSNAHVDHNHATKEVRGILCNNCNTAIGFLRENTQIMRNMIDYLDTF